MLYSRGSACGQVWLMEACMICNHHWGGQNSWIYNRNALNCIRKHRIHSLDTNKVLKCPDPFLSSMRDDPVSVSAPKPHHTSSAPSRSFVSVLYLSRHLWKDFLAHKTKPKHKKLTFTAADGLCCPQDVVFVLESETVTLTGHKSFFRASAQVIFPSHFTLSQSEVSVLPNRAGPRQGFSHIRAKNVQPVFVCTPHREWETREESTWNDRKRDKLPYLERTSLAWGMGVFVYIPQNPCFNTSWMDSGLAKSTTEHWNYINLHNRDQLPPALSHSVYIK